jgi:hypothetical protein
MVNYRFVGWSAAARQARLFGLAVGLATFVCACGSTTTETATTDGGADGGSKASGVGDAAKDRPPDVKACNGDAGPATKGNGEPCACNGECRTGYCADGVCCSSGCTDTCRACNLPTSLGECAPLPAGVRPTDPTECPADPNGTCKKDGFCDGNGSCQLYVAGVECSGGTCDGDGLSGVETCDGNGSCSGGLSKSCDTFSCDPKKNECYSGLCTSDSVCAQGHHCVSGSCGQAANGFACTNNDGCLSGFCSGSSGSKVCCNVACDGACVSCSVPGAFGRCRLTPAGMADTSGQCQDQSASTCGTTKYCDGSGACANWPATTTPCAPSACVGQTLLDATSVCDGNGTCQPPALVDCSPFLCVGGQCTSSCKSDGDCDVGHSCVIPSGATVGTCGKGGLGQPCGGATDCESSFCVDGVCCENSCDGACRRCDAIGSPGRCVNVTSGAADPRNICTDDGANSCGYDSKCDGNGNCEVYAVGSKCGESSCHSGSFADAPTCNVARQCVSPPSQSCNPYACSGSVCFDRCTDNSQCVSGNQCVNNSCGLKPPGAVCSQAIECQTGFCAQGVCCTSACTDACKSCGLAGTAGLCTAVADGTTDPQGGCKNSGGNPCGYTGKCTGGACAYSGSAQGCKPGNCVGTTSATPPSNCDGRGNCVTPPDRSCSPFLCGNSACLSSCTADTDCIPPNTCVNNSCGKKSNGGQCTSGAQCSSGNCTEGVCCDSACSDATTGGLCVSCKVSGKEGTCSPVPDGQGDPKQRCQMSPAWAGDCSNFGTCNGEGACAPWASWWGCRQATCTGDVFTPAANCDGAGHCPTPPSAKCDPYQCSSTSPSCLTTCTSDNDCVKETCLQTNNTCGTQLANSQNCKANSDCVSGNCTEGVCCNTACTGACQSCVVQSKVGTCTSIPANASPRDSTTCAANLPCGNTGKCDGNAGCQQPAAGTTCSDGNACTNGDSCSNGKCVSGPALSCDDGNVCTDDSCDPSKGCVHANNSKTCDDGNKCTTGEACSGGKCGGGATVNCNDNNVCTDDSCDPSKGCVYANNTKSCDTGDKCTAGGVCSGGKCTGTAVNCDDGNPCTDDKCDSTGGCTHTNNAAACNDNSACTTNDVCSGGTCSGSAVSCDDHNSCTDDSCDPVKGCQHANNSASCTIDACTTGATCSGGTCKGGTAVSCDDHNPCTDDSCDPIKGCQHAPNSASCTIDACTTGATCSGGTCKGGTAVSCDDHNPCTNDNCDPVQGCQHAPNTVSCTIDACTTGATCSGGTCKGGTAVSCDDRNPCTNDSCDPVQGCQHAPNTASCTIDACTTGATCSGGTCKGGAAVSCDDHNPCTDDSCDSVQGCQHAPNAASCTIDACTAGATCSGGTCKGGTAVSCDDRNPCTNDSCDPVQGCQHAPNTASCTIDACTTGATCSGGTCTGGTAIGCDDHNPCTDDSCDSVQGCQHAPNAASCMIDACTTGATCSGGTCKGGTAIGCDDHNPCTDDSCDSVQGCQHAPNTAVCTVTAGCSSDQHSQIPSSGSCTLGTCVGTSQPCNLGYLCVSNLCQTTCSDNTACDVAAGYTCDTTTQPGQCSNSGS